MNYNPKLSIIIPCFNDLKFIENAVKYANIQTYDNKEIIVVDDGSNLETKKVLKNLETKIDNLITQKNSGAGAARNTGIKEANGDFILVIRISLTPPSYRETYLNLAPWCILVRVPETKLQVLNQVRT